jgi:hypothetical protein
MAEESRREMYCTQEDTTRLPVYLSPYGRGYSVPYALLRCSFPMQLPLSLSNKKKGKKIKENKKKVRIISRYQNAARYVIGKP